MNYSGGDNGEAGYGSASGKQSGKDFVLEVCREATRSRCKRSESQCRYAHPTPNVHIIDGKVQCCADFLKVTDIHLHDMICINICAVELMRY